MATSFTAAPRTLLREETRRAKLDKAMEKGGQERRTITKAKQASGIAALTDYHWQIGKNTRRNKKKERKIYIPNLRIHKGKNKFTL